MTAFTLMYFDIVIYTIGSSSDNDTPVDLFDFPFFSEGSIKAVSKKGDTDSIRRPDIPPSFFSFPGPLI